MAEKPQPESPPSLPKKIKTKDLISETRGFLFKDSKNISWEKRNKKFSFTKIFPNKAPAISFQKIGEDLPVASFLPTFQVKFIM